MTRTVLSVAIMLLAPFSSRATCQYLHNHMVSTAMTAAAIKELKLSKEQHRAIIALAEESRAEFRPIAADISRRYQEVQRQVRDNGLEEEERRRRIAEVREEIKAMIHPLQDGLLDEVNEIIGNGNVARYKQILFQWYLRRENYYDAFRLVGIELEGDLRKRFFPARRKFDKELAVKMAKYEWLLRLDVLNSVLDDAAGIAGSRFSTELPVMDKDKRLVSFVPTLDRIPIKLVNVAEIQQELGLSLAQVRQFQGLLKHYKTGGITFEQQMAIGKLAAIDEEAGAEEGAKHRASIAKRYTRMLEDIESVLGAKSNRFRQLLFQYYADRRKFREAVELHKKLTPTETSTLQRANQRFQTDLATVEARLKIWNARRLLASVMDERAVNHAIGKPTFVTVMFNERSKEDSEVFSVLASDIGNGHIGSANPRRKDRR